MKIDRNTPGDWLVYLNGNLMSKVLEADTREESVVVEAPSPDNTEVLMSETFFGQVIIIEVKGETLFAKRPSCLVGII